MALTRYLLYFLGIGLATWLLTALEIWSPGSLRMQAQGKPPRVASLVDRR